MRWRASPDILFLPEVGMECQNGLKGASVLCVARWLGSPLLLYLAPAASGGSASSISMCHTSNLQRQLFTAPAVANPR